jgi:hypothetical protein
VCRVYIGIVECARPRSESSWYFCPIATTGATDDHQPESSSVPPSFWPRGFSLPGSHKRGRQRFSAIAAFAQDIAIRLLRRAWEQYRRLVGLQPWSPIAAVEAPDLLVGDIRTFFGPPLP